MSKTLTKAQIEVLAYFAGQPDGAAPVNTLPEGTSWYAYANCREHRLISQRKGRGGFPEARITNAGRAAIAAAETSP